MEQQPFRHQIGEEDDDEDQDVALGDRHVAGAALIGRGGDGRQKIFQELLEPRELEGP